MSAIAEGPSNGAAKEVVGGQPHEVKSYELDGVHDGGDMEDQDSYHGYLGSTKSDKREMDRMGKKQVLRRNFRPLSAISFAVMVQCTWEIILVASSQGLVDGGLAGLFWSYIWSFFGMLLVIISLAEMASMAPTSGGQYHWVSEFAPPRYQRFLSHMMGWQSTLSWQAGTASGPFLLGTIVQALIIENDPTYSPTGWQGTLLVFAATILIFLANIWGARILPHLQNLTLFVHIAGFLTIMIVFWVLSPRNTAEVVFTQFTNLGGWETMGVALMVGQLSAIFGLVCSDAAAHMSEEIRDAGVIVPHAIIYSYVLNGALGLLFIISFLFTITDLEAALDDTTGYVFFWIFRNCVSRAALNGLTFLVLFLLFMSTVSFNLSCSRETWAFARDKGLPCSSWIAHVSPRLSVPANAVGVTCAFTAIISLINIGSTVGLYAIISLNLVSLMLTYAVSCGCVLYRRLYHPELLPKARWSLGKFWGPIVNAGGVAYSIFTFFWCFWPVATPAPAPDFNWACLMFVISILVSTIDYFVRARKPGVFEGPVVLVDGFRHEN